MNRSPHLHPALTVVLVFAMLLSPLTPAVQAQEGNPVWLPLVGNGAKANQLVATDILFRTQITVTSPTQWTRLMDLGVTVLKQMESSAVVLADYEQLADLARLRFEPRNSEEFGALVNAGAEEKLWLARSLRALSEQAQTVSGEIGSPLEAMSAQPRSTSAALIPLRSATQSLTMEVRSALSSLPSLDDDGDGLTNTEEGWWCTDATNPNSDGDTQGYTDGQEVAALLDVTIPRNVRWGYETPFGPPNAWPNFNNRDGTGVKICNDGDFDTIPDYAEAYMVGTRPTRESTDNDKFDDGQELFGLTYCPGAPTNCGYGSYPAIEYWNFIKASMPNWVLPPGDSPFVAAFPVPEVYVVPSSWVVERVTTITTTEGEIVEQTNSYETAVTRGQSTSIANTVTWNEWEEVSESVEQPIASRIADVPGGELSSSDPRKTFAEMRQTWGIGFIGLGAVAWGGCALITGGACLAVGAVALGLATAGVSEFNSGTETLIDLKSDEIQTQSKYQPTGFGCLLEQRSSCPSLPEEDVMALRLSQNIDNQGIATSLDGVNYSLSQQNFLLSRGLQDVAYAISQPRYTETRTSGKSWGGAQTTTHEVYEEHTVSQGEAFTTGQNWSTAWAVNSSHAADLTFRYTVQNSGTEYARELSNLVFNIYLGDDKLPTVTYAAWEQFAGGKLDNLFPVGPNTPAGVGGSKTFASNPIPLSLEQMKRIDLGERLTVKVESYSYGADELFYTDAVNGGVTVFIEDGIADGDESVDMYVIPTWGVESVEDVLTRYFPAAYDADGNINSLWTPEFSGADAPTWHEHYLSDIAWWNVYLTQSDAGDTALKDLPARAGSGILFRFNRDSDRDGYNDRAEFRYYCALPTGHADRVHCDDAHLRADIHPQPELLAGYVFERDGDVVTAKLALENTGNFDGYGIDAVMYSPDDTTTIGNNTVGGNGRVRPGSSVVVGSMIKQPSLNNWGSSTSKPYTAGQFSGAEDLTFTFSAETPGVVGTGSTTVRWDDGIGNSDLLDLGANYRAPLPLDVAHGVQVGFNTGTVAAGASFTMTALTARDTFTFTVNSEPFTPPVIVVSYSHPQGSTRFVTPVELSLLGDSLVAHSGEMLEGLGLQIVSDDVLKVDAANTTHLVVNSPHPATIKDAHLHLNFVSDGKLVLEQSHTLDILPGPTTFSAQWAVSDFSADYNPDGDNLLIAFWTDSENNIIDSTARPLPSFAVDPRPTADSDAANWAFGTVTQGEVLQRTVSLASVGELGLLGYVGDVPGLSVSQVGSKPVNLGDLVTYDLTLDTRVLEVGPYDETLVIRTSDPLHPTYTIQVTGVIEPLVGDAYARPVVDRPLDVEVWVQGDHQAGEWITFTHSLGPDAQSLHPVKVYDTNSALQGVGAVATDLSEGTASADMFGNGADGDLTISSDVTFNSPRTSLGATVSAGATSVILGSASGFNKGDELLIIQVQGVGTGNYEFRHISTVSGNTLTLNKALAQTYTQEGNSKAQIIRVPNYRSVLITSSGRWRAPAWDGNTGGVLVIKANNQVVIEQGGIVDATGKGFMGGPSVNTQQTAYAGEGIAGIGTWQNAANMNGGGGGQQQCEGGPGGGGGGLGTAGSPGQYGLGSGLPGMGGMSVGSADMSYLYFGGGGGGGARSFSNPGGTGGRGGGVIFIGAHSFTLNGMVTNHGNSGANGIASSQPPENQWGYPGGGGGGAGGATLIRVAAADISNLQPVSSGGSGGASSGSGGVIGWCGPGHARSGAGGSGGQGRIRIEYCDTLNGAVNPLASIQKTTCHIAEQTAPASGRLNLPKPVAEQRDYRIQYGYKLDFTAAGEMTATLRVPSGEWTGTSLEALVSGMGSGDVDFKLDVGGDGWDWEETKSIDNNGSFITNTLASAFANYVSATGEIDVPIKIYLSKPGQLLLTNMVIQRNESVDVAPSFTLSGTPTEGASVPINVTLTNNGAVDSGPLTVAFYATRDSQSATPVYIGSKFVSSVSKDSPNQFTFNWNTLGFTGPVTVTGSVDPYNQLAETNETNNNQDAKLTILTRPDLVFSEVTLSDDEPLVGETVQVTATLANGGQTAAGAQTVSLFRDNPDGGGTSIQEKSVNSVSALAEQTVTFAWTPTTPGLYRLFLRGDRNNQIDEFDENNNDRWLDVYVGFGRSIALDSGGGGEPTYSAQEGYGVVDEGKVDVMGQCGSEPHQTYRQDTDGQLRYRFDHLLPGHFYHLDVTLYNCPEQAQRLQSILVDGATITAQPIDLGDGAVHRLSFLLDPAFYIDRSVDVAITAGGINGAVVNEIKLHDVDYRYVDAGGANDPQYSGTKGYGWLDGTDSTAWGRLPIQSVRTNQQGKELHYRFDGLKSDKRYNVHLAFWQGSDSTPTPLKVQIDDIDSGSTFNVITGERQDKKIAVLPMHYQQDGSIVVSVVRPDVNGPFVNEIALEEETVAAAATCVVRPTTSSMQIFGPATIEGVPAPTGTVVQAINPRGDTVGCFTVTDSGLYGEMFIYAEDATASPPIPGMRDGELVTFRVNGAQAVAAPATYWREGAVLEISLDAGRVEGQSILLSPDWNFFSLAVESAAPLVGQILSSVDGRYDRVVAEEGVYLPNRNPIYNTLKELHCGPSYLVRVTGGTTASLLVEGRPCAADAPIQLHSGWNWIGYPLTVSLPVTTALQSVDGRYQRVINLSQSYDPARPAFSTLKQFEPDKGYMIYMNEAAALVYPTAESASVPALGRPALALCAGVRPTPNATLLYGTLQVDGEAAPAGTQVELVTPAGAVAGCFVVEQPGLYGMVFAYGADGEATPPIPGFGNGDEIRVRVNGILAQGDAPILWQDDKMPHQVDLSVTSQPTLYLPLIGGEGE